MTPPGLEPRPLDANSNTQTIRPPCVHHCVSRLSNYGMHGWPHGIMNSAPHSKSKAQTLCVWARNFAFAVPLSTQEHTANRWRQLNKEPAKMLGGR